MQQEFSEGANVVVNPVHESLHRFVNSPMFFRIFDQTIALVQEVSGYIDGQGRHDCAQLKSADAAIFQAESVRLSSLLMQISSWLLAKRAFFKGNADTLSNVTLVEVEHPSEEHLMTMPLRMVVLGQRTRALHKRIAHLDAQIRYHYMATTVN